MHVRVKILLGTKLRIILTHYIRYIRQICFLDLNKLTSCIDMCLLIDFLYYYRLVNVINSFSVVLFFGGYCCLLKLLVLYEYKEIGNVSGFCAFFFHRCFGEFICVYICNNRCNRPLFPSLLKMIPKILILHSTLIQCYSKNKSQKLIFESSNV